VRIGPALIPESFNVNDDDAPVNGQLLLILHLSPTREEGGSEAPTNPKA
jgi:hypothetical protein